LESGLGALSCAVEVSEPGNGTGGDAGEDVLEPDEGIDPSPLAGGHEAPQHGRRSSALVAAKEYPVVATDCYTADDRDAQQRGGLVKPSPSP